MPHTPGPWRRGRSGSVVSDTPVPEMRGSGDVEFYGGHLICESVTDTNYKLIIAAPDLLEACMSLIIMHHTSGRCKYCNCKEGHYQGCPIAEALNAVAKAHGVADFHIEEGKECQ